jgi:hypothetical protein
MSTLDAQNSAESICHGVRERLLVLDGDLRVKAASSSFYEGFHVAPDQTLNRPLSELGDGQWNFPALLTMLKELGPGDETLNDFEVEHEFPGLGTQNHVAQRPAAAGEWRDIKDDSIGDRRYNRVAAHRDGTGQAACDI